MIVDNIICFVLIDKYSSRGENEDLESFDGNDVIYVLSIPVKAIF